MPTIPGASPSAHSPSSGPTGSSSGPIRRRLPATCPAPTSSSTSSDPERRRGDARVSELGSAPVPDVGDEDHVRGLATAPLVIVYADFECPFCAALHGRLHTLEARLVFRHFPVRSSHPRAWPAACAA